MYSDEQTPNDVLTRLFVESASSLLAANGLDALLVRVNNETRQRLNRPTFVSVLSASGEMVRFTSTICLDRELLLHVHPMGHSGISQRELEDWCRELNNQLVGRVKNKLLAHGCTVSIGLPVLLLGIDVKAVLGSNMFINNFDFESEHGRMEFTLNTVLAPGAEFREISEAESEEYPLWEGAVALF